MKRLRLIVLGIFLSVSCLGQAQSKLSEYLAVIDALDLEDLRATMLQTSDQGLNPKSYWTDEMEWAYLRGGAGSPTLKTQANQNYLRLLQDVSLGMVNPELMGTDVKLPRKTFVTAKQLNVLLLTHGTRAGPLFESFTPQSPPYLALKESLKRISGYCNQNEWGAIPAVKKVLKLGAKNSSLPAIKNRLRQLGYNVPSVDDLFDGQTLAAINDVQWMLRFKPDGVISPNGKTWKYLNVSCQDRMRQVRLDMEKMRWFPQTFEDRYIFINLAMSYFSLVDKSKGSLYTMSFRTINGRPARKSPTMKDKIVYIIINPFWVVPPTIFREDKLEDIRNLRPWEISYYFDSHNYEVWNKSFTRRIDPSTIDWWRVDPNADTQIFIRQRPHYMNALGVLKFMMTNSYAIYLHDTNQRELFAEPQRLLSSGCVRIERPLDLAEYLLQGTPWTRDVIEKNTAKPGEVLDRETRVSLKQPIPVYMAFLTSQLSSDGVIRFAEDSYNQGHRLLQRGAW
ncbi:MAG: L,D-transpeptidase family protein [Bdellovibrio sp.]|nr:L,D-transpeptidase family protein [Bdellovibrio sp.]